MRHFLFIISSTLYGLSLATFTVFWAGHFSRYTTYKGDEFFMLAEYFLAAAYIFYITTVFPFKKINFFFAMAIPVIGCFGAIVIGMLILFVTGMEGFPKQYIIIYGFLYDVLTLLPAVLLKWRVLLFNQKIQ